MPSGRNAGRRNPELVKGLVALPKKEEMGELQAGIPDAVRNRSCLCLSGCYIEKKTLYEGLFSYAFAEAVIYEPCMRLIRLNSSSRSLSLRVFMPNMAFCISSGWRFSSSKNCWGVTSR